MTPHSLFPAYFQLRVLSAFGTHFHSIPTREYNVATGEFLNWNDVGIDATDMIEDFVDLILPFHVSTTTVLGATIFTLADEDDPPQPRAFVSFTGKDGTSVAAATPASEGVYTFRTTNFGLLKYVFLDAPVTDDFLPFEDISDSAALVNLFGLVSDATNAFAGRDNGRPNQFIRANFGLNKALQKKYNRP